MGQAIDFGVGMPGAGKQKGNTGIAQSFAQPAIQSGRDPFTELGKFASQPLDYLGNAAGKGVKALADPFKNFMSGYRGAQGAGAAGAGASNPFASIGKSFMQGFNPAAGAAGMAAPAAAGMAAPAAAGMAAPAAAGAAGATGAGLGASGAAGAAAAW